jgi:competence protein ComEC
MPALPSAADLVRPADLRAVLLGASGWAGAVALRVLPAWSLVAVVLALLGWIGVRMHARRSVATIVGCLLAAGAVAGVTTVRAEANRTSAVGRLAAAGSSASVTARVTSDPVLRQGRFGGYTLTRVTVTQVRGRGLESGGHVPVLVIGGLDWRHVALGSVVQASGRLGPSNDADLAGVLSTSSAPRLVGRPAAVLDAAGRVRAGIREAVGGSRDARALVPALVVGDDQQMSQEVVADFRTCGLTHLAAVSGTNLTLVVGFLLLLARWCGLRAHALHVVGLVGVLAFVLLARPEPSVLRAAVMGSVSLVGLGARGRDQGVRALGIAVLALLLLDPWLAVSLGFVLSSLATAGILLLAPPFRDAMSRWLPRSVAEALAVPFAAQLACTPVVAAISGQVSLVAVLANLVVAPVVGPATVLGLLGGLTVLVVGPLGHGLGWLAGLCASWIITVAVHLSALPSASVEWSAGVASLTCLSLLCVVAAVAASRVLRRAGWSVASSLVLVVLLVRPLPSPGWPPAGWVLVACDVGQGDGLVLDAGHGRAVVVDTGPDPRLMDRCLRRLGVRRLPVVVLTHFHADHVDGLPAVLRGRQVGEIEVTATDDPPGGAAAVRRWAAAAHVPVRVPAYGETDRVGALTWQVIGPVRAPDGSASSSPEEGSRPNNASLVLLVQVRGVSILMSGDMEPPAQQLVEQAMPSLHVDVLKVPHHGSRYQDVELLRSLGAHLALISVGKDNDYGHPAASTLALLRQAGMRVERTDRDGDIAVTVRDGRIAVRTLG